MAKQRGITYQSLMGTLRKKEFAPVYLLHGEESFFIDEISSYIDQNVLDDGEKDFNQVVLYGKETNAKQVVDNARQFPMMASHRVVIIREAQEMKDILQLEEYCKNPSEQAILLINFKHRKFDQRKAMAKAIAKTGVLFESKKLYDNQVPQWIEGHASTHNLKIGSAEALLMSEFIGSNLSKIDNELEKLSQIKGEDRNISLDEIKQHIGMSKEYNVFELNNAIGEKNVLKANRIINYFASNPKSTHITVVIGSLFSYFSRVLIVNENFSKNDKDLATLLKMHTAFFIRDYRNAARLYTRPKLENIIKMLADYDLRSKGVGNRNTSNDALLKELVFKILH